MLFNKISFDWNIVAELDPDYVKYLVDDNPLNKGIDIKEPEFDRDPVPRRLSTTSMEDIRLEGRTNEELEIIRMLHKEEASETADLAPLRTAIQELRDDFDICYLKADEIKADPHAFDPVYKLRPEYKNHKLPAKMNPLQLMPPKSVLGNGSSIYIGSGDVVHYRVDVGTYRPEKKMKRLVKTKITDNGKMMRLIRASYDFIPAKNIVSDRKSGFGCLTYNTETRRMYRISKKCTNPNSLNKTARRYTRKIYGIGLNHQGISILLSATNARITEQFIRRLHNRIRKDVPDAFLPDLDNREALIEQQAYRIILLVLQHKVGKKIEWLDLRTLSNLTDVIANPHFPIEMSEKYDRTQANGERKRRVGKIIPNLKKYNNYTCFIESLFGKFYHKILLKVVPLNIPNHVRNDILKWMTGRKSAEVPKFVYHWFTEILRMENRYAQQKEKALQNVVDFVNEFSSASKRNKGKLVNMFDLYVKTSKRFIANQNAIETWTLWRDMYYMAERFGLRIRPNKFKNAHDIRKLHDDLSDLEHRDAHILMKYKGVNFEPFEHPDKEYGDGFKFVWLGTPEALMEEGRMMHHCVGGYADRCMEGTSIIFSMRKGNRGYVTIELNGEDYSLWQQYTIKDFTVRNEKILGMINKWHSDVLNMHREDIVSYKQKCRVKVAKFKLESKIKSLEEYLSDFRQDDELELKSLIEKRLETAKKYLAEFDEKVESGEILDEKDLFEEDDGYSRVGWPVAQAPNY